MADLLLWNTLPSIDREILRLRRQLQHYYGKLDHNKSITFMPRAEIIDTISEYILRIELPGVDRKDITVDVDDKARVLTVAGEIKPKKHHTWKEKAAKLLHAHPHLHSSSAQQQQSTLPSNEKKKESTTEKQDSENSGTSVMYTERKIGRFSRSWALPADSDVNAINARLDSGVLDVHVSKLPRPPSNKKSISIH